MKNGKVFLILGVMMFLILIGACPELGRGAGGGGGGKAFAFTEHINFQGRLTSTDATPITTQVTVDFKLYNVESGGAAQVTSRETFTPDLNGVFSTLLAFDSSDFDGADKWLEVVVDPTGSPDILIPRQKIAPVPYAYRALTAESVAGGVYVLKAGDTMTGKLTISGANLKVVGSAEIGDADCSATGQYSVAIGRETTAEANYSFATGYRGVASGNYSIVMGRAGTASGVCSVAMGQATNASGGSSMALGTQAKALHYGTFVWADGTVADFASTAEKQFLIRATGGVGVGTTAALSELTVQGTIETRGTGGIKFPDGTIQITKATGGASPWTETVAGTVEYKGAGNHSLVVGDSGNQATGTNAAAFGGVSGKPSIASGLASFATGYNGVASGTASFTTGYTGIASGKGSFVGGNNAVSSSFASFAFGNQTTASGGGAVAIGKDAKALGDYSYAFGEFASAGATSSFAMGNRATSVNSNSFVWSDGTNFSSTTNNQFLIRATNGVGIGTNETSGVALVADGTIEARSGGIKFPDGTIQTTKAGDGGISTAEADTKYVNIAGDTMTGTLTIGATGRALYLSGGNLKVVGSAEIGTSDCSAKGLWSLATGWETTASGFTSVAMGESTSAGEAHAVAMGQGATATGDGAVAMGSSTIASGDNSLAIGSGAETSGSAAVATGSNTTASGDYSVAMGRLTVAGGGTSMATGYRAKANHTGTFVWADSENADFVSTAQGQFLIRATGGVGIGTALTSPEVSLLRVAGTIESTLGGIKFPDGSIQTSASTLSAGDYVLKAGDTMTGALTIEESHLVISPEANVLKALEIKPWAIDAGGPSPQYGLYVDAPSPGSSNKRVTAGYFNSFSTTAEFASRQSTPAPTDKRYAGYFTDGDRSVYLAYDDEADSSYAGYFDGGKVKIKPGADVEKALEITTWETTGDPSPQYGLYVNAPYAALGHSISSGYFAAGTAVAELARTAGGPGEFYAGRFNLGDQTAYLAYLTAGGASSKYYSGYFQGDSYFSGDVGIGTLEPQAELHVEGSVEVSGNLNISGALSKGSGSFLIDHPLDPKNKVLRHSFVESPDMKNVYDGVVILDMKGEAKIEMPEYFEALNQDFRYQLTPLGASMPDLHVKQEIKENKFVIAGGIAGRKVSWQITGSRQDAYAKKNPIVVEEDKPYGKKGTYLHPEAFE